MSSWFDSVVYDRRRKNQWMTPSLLAFARDVLSNIWLDKDDQSDTSVVFTAVNRPDVASRVWYTLEWLSEDGKRKSVSAQEFDLVMWRAAVTEMDVREEAERKRVGCFRVKLLTEAYADVGPEFDTLTKALQRALEFSLEDKAIYWEVWTPDGESTLAIVHAGLVYRNG